MIFVLGIDIGGTFSKFGLFALSEKLFQNNKQKQDHNTPDKSMVETVFFSSLPTPNLSQSESILTFIQDLKAAYHSLCSSPSCTPHLASLLHSSPSIQKNCVSAQSSMPPIETLSCMGIALPGVVSSDGSFDFFPNTAIDFPLFSQLITRAFPQTHISYLNDANAAAYAEHICGAAKDYQDSLLITLGTGLGAGIIMNNKLCIGAQGFAGEMGHISVEPNGYPCPCGKKGCLQMYSSASALVRLYLEARSSYSSCSDCSDYVKEKHSNPPQNAREVFSLLSKKDPAAQKALNILCEKLAFALSQISCVINPGIILIGGGISEQGEVFLPLVSHYYERYALPALPKVPLKAAILGNKAGSLGAALYSLPQQQTTA